ncbi:ABC transporter permease [Mycobacterium sp. 236(2023)]|uniref:ABC transporter permease n=1 Tax=Mycobacterium sp. 236(2023) TaxID=3038163 RepID=UPI0024158D4D|nr:ABC transporter permease [Mycobacterium sp. 236(2023)]MDG4663361.1 ABC transporter permease [Mycobacterium sp. 236(2023)]
MIAAGAIVNAERIKLMTLRSPLWSAAAVAVLSFGLAALQASVAYGYDRMTVASACLGVAVFGIPVLMIVAAMTLTGEYRSGLIATTFMATPRRTSVLFAKALVAAVFSVLFAVVMVFGSVMVARLVAEPGVGAGLTVVATVRFAAALSLYAALAAVLGVGVAALLRHTAGAVTVLLLWPLLVEPLLGNLPGRGWEIGPFLPFANVFRFLEVQWLFPEYVMHWGAPGSLGYFAAVVAVIFVAAVVTVNRRDA